MDEPQGRRGVRRSALVLLACWGLSACVTSTSVVSAGPETYTVSASASVPGTATASAQQRAYADATAYCAHHGGGQMQVASQTSNTGINSGSATVTFRCAR